MRNALTPRAFGLFLGIVTVLAVPVIPARAQFGGAGFGGGMSSTTQANLAGSMGMGGVTEQWVPIRKSSPHPVTAAAARVWLVLQQPVDMPFQNESPLEDVIQYIQSATETPEMPQGIPVYVDPRGLQEAERTFTSPIVLNLKGMPLATSLSIMLEQLGLTYFVHKDGLLWITAAESGDRTSDQLTADTPLTAKAARTWIKLHEPVDIHLGGETPLSEALKTLKAGSDEGRLTIYLDPIALRDEDVTLDSPVQMDLENVPRATVLTLLTEQLHLNWRVRPEGIVIIGAEEAKLEDELPEGHGAETIAQLQARLQEEKLKAEIARYRLMVENPQGTVPSGGGFQSRPVE